MDFLPDELKLAIRIAKQMASKWQAVSEEDAIAYLNLWLVENYKTVVRYRIEPGDQKKLDLALRRAIQKYCVKEQTVANGGTLNDSTFYTKQQIKRLIPYIWELESWSQTTTHTTKNGASPMDFDNALAMLADISGAYHGLKQRDKDLLRFRYKDQLSYDQVAIKLNLTSEAVRKTTIRAIDKLHSNLGGTNPVWTSGNKHK